MIKKIIILTIIILSLFAKSAQAVAVHETVKFSSPFNEITDGFGSASKVWGDTAFVGSWTRVVGGDMNGVVDIFKYTPDDPIAKWNYTRTIIPNERSLGQMFGNAIAVNNNYLVIGAMLRKSIYGKSGKGAVFVYKRSGDTYQETQMILPPSADSVLGRFGTSLDLHGDTLIVGEPAYNDGINFYLGAAYVYQVDASGTWQLTQTIIGTEHDAYFGWSVAINDTYMAIGAPLAYSNYRGKTYIYSRTSPSNYYIPHLTLTAESDTEERFGTSLSVSDNNVIIGAPGSTAEINKGSIYHVLITGDQYVMRKYQIASEHSDYAQFGVSVSMRNNFVIAGATGQESYTTPGYAFMYKLENNRLQRIAEFIPSDSQINDDFGSTVATDGQNFIVSAFGLTSEGIWHRGYSYLFTKLD